MKPGFLLLPLTLLLLLSSFALFAQQTHRQFGLGLTRSFLPVNKMLIGRVGIEQIPQATLWFDYNKSIRSSKKGLRWGASASVNYEKFFYTIDQPLPYFTPTREWFIFLAGGIKNVEVYGYLGKQFELYRSEKWRIRLFSRLGPVFHINPYPNYIEASSNLRDNGSSSFRLYEIDFSRPNWYVPYLRGLVSLDFVKRYKSGLEIGIAPQVSFAAFSNEDAVFLTVLDDPAYRSLGTFKMKRGFYGINLVIAK
jgi:hypothetical protein